jgi:hypothetical protein
MMCKKLVYLMVAVFALSLTLEKSAYGFDPLNDPNLVGWWSFDEGEGTVAHDASGFGREGILLGGVTWAEGRFGNAVLLDGHSGHLSIPAFSLTTDTITFAMWVNGWKGGDWAPFFSSRGADSCEMHFGNDWVGALRYTWNNDSSSTYGWAGGPAVPQNTWALLAVTIAPDKATAYVYTDEAGLHQSSNSITHIEQTLRDLQMGYSFDARRIRGILDEAAVYNRALTPEEIMHLTKGPTSPAQASALTPEDAGTDVPRDAVLHWRPGSSAAFHDVYVGTTWADVNNASIVNPQDVLLSQENETDSFSPQGMLDYGQTYYWRVDAINAAPDHTVFKGDIRHFTVEPYAYPIQVLRATASSSSSGGTGPEKTIDGSGLNASDQHSNASADMWLSQTETQAWIQYEFYWTYNLNEMWVWNANQMIEPFVGVGAKDVSIEYSDDGINWVALEGASQFAQGTGATDYLANTVIDFDGVAARFVKITIHSAWGAVSQYGLSEMRFYAIPMQAREPHAQVGQTSDGLDAILTWRPGRKAAWHRILLGDDRDAVVDGSAIVDTRTATRYSVTGLGLQYGTTYYWRVDEVNEARTPPVYTGDVWSFTTPDQIVIDDFDQYNDDCHRIFFSWLDGLGHAGQADCGVAPQPGNGSGAAVGYGKAPYAEKSLVISGQSLPLAYDNALEPYYSEATSSNLALASDWTRGGVEALSLQFRGYPSPFTEHPDGSMVLSSASLDIWDNADEFRYVYKKLQGNGSIVARVDSLVNTDAWAKCGIMIRETLEPNSKHAMVVVTPENGVAFQCRDAIEGSSWDTHTGAFAAPYWVKLMRAGDSFSAAYSEDGVHWTHFTSGMVASRSLKTPSRNIKMKDDVYIGLALTSQTRANPTIAHVSEVSTQGQIAGPWQVEDVGGTQLSNDAESLYITVKDIVGYERTIIHPDPEAALSSAWQTWQIPLNEFSPLDLSSIETISLGLGDRDNPRPGGAGILYIDNLYLTRDE